MQVSILDWSIVIGFFVLSLLIGIWSSKRSSKSFSEFFLSGRGMPWWLLGISMVATTFSADTPNLVTDIVRSKGVAGNWEWWAFLLTGMLTVFVYARLWRRSKVLTDLEFYELRYSGNMAAFLRGFRAIYLGVIFNILVMATVCLAAIKIGGTLLSLSPVQTLLLASVVTVFYSTFGGLRGIILTDFFQFILAMVGTIWAAITIINLPQVGGLDKLLANPALEGKLNLLPDFSDTTMLVSVFIIPIAVQWWAAYYPGAEPGGGGYVAQRMLAAKNEKNAVGATLLFNIAHYALRPWPWILIALASIVVFPMEIDPNAAPGSLAARGLASLKEAFPNIPDNKIGHDLAYPAMLTFLPSGLLGIVIASLIAAFMSTISTHLNWGSSYIVNDFYKRFVNNDAPEKQLVLIGRISTVVLMVFSAFIALALESAKEAFDIIVLVGAGTGLIFILRWFWWRINAYSELSGLIISFLVAIYFKLIHQDLLGFQPLEGWLELILSVLITTIGWVTVTYLTPPTDKSKLIDFYARIQPHAYGWRPIIAEAQKQGIIEGENTYPSNLSLELSAMIIGSFAIYGILFATGYWIYGQTTNAIIASVVAIIGSLTLVNIWRKIRF